MIIITGGAGFIGSNLIKKLNYLNIDDICLVDSFENGRKFHNIKDLNFKEIFDKIDLLPYLNQKKNLLKLISYFTLVLAHLLRNGI